jgi:hypothetical protein
MLTCNKSFSEGGGAAAKIKMCSNELNSSGLLVQKDIPEGA